MNNQKNTDAVLLEARDLQRAFKKPDGSELKVLRGVSFSLKQGQTLSIRGASGSGKSTLLNVLAGLEAPSSGEVLWQGRALTKMPRAEQAAMRARWLGFVFQSYYLLPELTAVQNVLLARRLVGRVRSQDHQRATELLYYVGLGERIDQVPAKLSGGERQRVAIARALMNRPSLILADEPTGNLDEATAGRIMNLLHSLCADEGVALLLVTHNEAFAQICSQCCLLQEGYLSQKSPLPELAEHEAQSP
jgi:predicted ABC-type transport system involved in lysophospholipase L1 biosynthesis ATPase subunit